MKSLFLMTLAYLLPCIAIVSQEQPGSAASSLEHKDEIAVSGVVTNSEDEKPVEKVTIEIYDETNRGRVFTATSNADGTFQLSGLPAKGDFTIKIKKDQCFTVVRKKLTARDLLDKDRMKWSITCCDPGLDVKPRTKVAIKDSMEYLGQYSIETICRTCRKASVILFTDSHIDPKVASCKCTDTRHIAIADPAGKCPSYGCWSASSDGSLEIYFPCEGISFAGTKWVIWNEGKELRGYTSGWTDCGCPPPVCELILRREKAK